MRNFTRPALILCAAAMALSACDPAEYDADPDVRRDARANRTCIAAVAAQTGAAAQLNTDLPVVEVNQYIIDVPTGQQRWMCRTDDEGTATQLYKMGQG
jgi:precorrin-4 methylase